MIWIERFAEHYKKIALGFGAASVAAGSVVAAFDKLDVFHKAAIYSGAYTLCAIGGWVWARYQETGFTRKRIETELATKSEIVIRPEDHLAHRANKCARRFFGRKTISFQEYRLWRRKNPFIFTAVVGPDRDLYGFFDIFPLREETGRDLREGNKSENDLTIDDIVPLDQIDRSNYIYVATIMACACNDHLQARLVDHMAEFMFKHYPPREGRFYMAFAETKEGRNLLKRNNFILELNKELTSCKRDFFVLDATRVPTSLQRLDVARQQVRRRGSRKISTQSPAPLMA